MLAVLVGFSNACGDTFKSTSVKDMCPKHFPKTGVWVVLLYQDNCPPCEKLKPKFIEKARDSNVQYGALNCGMHWDWCRATFPNIVGVPTLIVVDEGKLSPLLRDLHEVDSFLRANVVLKGNTGGIVRLGEQRKAPVQFVNGVAGEEVLDGPHKECRKSRLFANTRVIDLCPNTFDASVAEGVWLVVFYHAMKDIKQLDDLINVRDVRVGAIDCYRHSKWCAGMQIYAYPTYRAYGSTARGIDRYKLEEALEDTRQGIDWYAEAKKIRAVKAKGANRESPTSVWATDGLVRRSSEGSTSSRSSHTSIGGTSKTRRRSSGGSNSSGSSTPTTGGWSSDGLRFTEPSKAIRDIPKKSGRSPDGLNDSVSTNNIIRDILELSGGWVSDGVVSSRSDKAIRDIPTTGGWSSDGLRFTEPSKSVRDTSKTIGRSPDGLVPGGSTKQAIRDRVELPGGWSDGGAINTAKTSGGKAIINTPKRAAGWTNTYFQDYDSMILSLVKNRVDRSSWKNLEGPKLIQGNWQMVKAGIILASMIERELSSSDAKDFVKVSGFANLSVDFVALNVLDDEIVEIEVECKHVWKALLGNAPYWRLGKLMPQLLKFPPVAEIINNQIHSRDAIKMKCNL